MHKNRTGSARQWALLAAVSLAVLVPTLFGLGSVVVLAQDTGGRYRPTVEERNACLADFRKLCPGVRVGGGRVRKCFEEHYAQLTPLCQRAVAASRENRG